MSITSDIIQASFGKEKAITGAVRCPPLPGSPRNRNIDFKSTLRRALDGAHAYADGLIKAREIRARIEARR